MKNFLVCIVLPFLIISCSTDSDFNNSENSHSSAIETNVPSKAPENQANPFDGKGKKYYKVLDLYWENNGVSNSFNEITKQIQFISKEYDLSRSANKISNPITTEVIADILNDPINSLTAIVETSSLSEEAKSVLIHFMTSLIALKENEYDVLYDHIISYEDTIMESTALSMDEKEILLSVASISRYSLYAESKHKDRDWEISVGNRTKQLIDGSCDISIASIIALLP